jgi:dimethylhistidine N-methyltransferase
MGKVISKAAISFHDFAPEQDSFLEEVVEGLSKQPKKISPKFLYDKRGSELFDEICTQPEYYPTQTEVGILQKHADDIAKHIEPGCVIVDLGSGTSEKARFLFDALKPVGYMGVDISKDFLLDATQKLAEEYPWLDVHAVCTDFSQQLELPEHFNGNQKLAFFPGSSIGNFEPEAALLLLKRIAAAIGEGGKLLIGVDVKKDKEILDAAYNDDAGITGEFNLNLLQRMQDELQAEVDVDSFSHHAFYNDKRGRVEMHLVSDCDQTIEIDGDEFSFSKDESIHTENSHKYNINEFNELAKKASFEVERVWTDNAQLFSVQLLRVGVTTAS